MMYAKGMSAQTREARRNRSLLKTEGNAWDCATAVRFLASDQARWITGSVITVDAGTTAVSAIVVTRLVAPDAAAPPAPTRALIARAMALPDWPAVLAALAATRQEVAAVWQGE